MSSSQKINTNRSTASQQLLDTTNLECNSRLLFLEKSFSVHIPLSPFQHKSLKIGVCTSYWHTKVLKFSGWKIILLQETLP